jgi:hypothetical protein
MYQTTSLQTADAVMTHPEQITQDLNHGSPTQCSLDGPGPGQICAALRACRATCKPRNMVHAQHCYSSQSQGRHLGGAGLSLLGLSFLMTCEDSQIKVE